MDVSVGLSHNTLPQIGDRFQRRMSDRFRENPHEGIVPGPLYLPGGGFHLTGEYLELEPVGRSLAPESNRDLSVALTRLLGS
jgi:diadenosine tetraphosphatase ApaH/serine/threonine PP2A family protein phosphatase